VELVRKVDHLAGFDRGLRRIGRQPGPWGCCAGPTTLPGLIVDCGGLVGSQDRGAAAQRLTTLPGLIVDCGGLVAARTVGLVRKGWEKGCW